MIDIRTSSAQDVHDAVETRILAVLDEHADGIGKPFILEKLAFEALEEGEVLGGLTARITQEWLYVSLLAVRAEARGKGVGQRLIAAAEDAARDRGLTGLWLDTFSFQAPEFYKKLGFTQFGAIPDSPNGNERMFFLKRLDRAAP